MSNNYRSNTMELDEILNEARNRKNGSASSAASAKSSTTPRRQTASVQPDIEDGYVDAATYRYTNQQAQYQQPQYQQYDYDDDDYDDYDSRKPRRKSKTGLVVALIIAGIVLLAGVGGLVMYLNSGSGTGPDSTFSDNVSVNGQSLKGLTMDEAKALLAPVEQSMADQIKITVNAGDKAYNLTKADFKYSFNTDAVLSEAKKYSEEKGIKTSDQNYEIKMTVSDETCSGIIDKISGEVSSEAKDAAVTAFDPDASDMFTISKEQKGVTINKEEALSALNTFIHNGNVTGTVNAATKEVEPKITSDYLKDNITELSHFSTYSTNNSNGNENMRISLAACNGSIINPGETWSFNDCTGNSNLTENGYLPAGVIVQGRSETGVGGGICQSSTTIYNAAILCGMNVVERACHYYKSTYVDAGRDATIDYGNIDLKVSNPFKYQLFMKCWMDGTELNCTIYGLENPNFDDVEISTTAPDYFSNGYTVHTTRYYYKDGTEIDSDELPSSTYYTSAPSSGSTPVSGSTYNESDSNNGGSSGGSDSGSGGSDGGSSGGSDGGSDGGSSGSDGGSSGGSDGGNSGGSDGGNSGGSDGGSGGSDGGSGEVTE